MNGPRAFIALTVLLASPLGARTAGGSSGLSSAEVDIGRDIRKKEAVLWAEFQQIEKDVNGTLGELDEIVKQYREIGLNEELEGRREEIRGRINSRLSNMYELKKVFKKLNVESYSHAAGMAAMGFIKGGMSDRTPDDIGGMTNTDQHFRAIHRYGSDVSKILYREVAEYDAARVATRRKTLLTRTAAAAGVALVVGLIVAYRKKAEVVPVLATPSPMGSVAAKIPELLDGNFRMGKEIGRGGMGLVYEATDEALDRKVAIKRMKKEVLENRRELDMFMEEARLVAALKHPNLVEIHSIVREGGQLYLVFEYVEGRPLHHIIEEAERLPHDRTVRMLRQIAEGLDYAHSQRVIHRDLKPANIMVGANDTVKIMDFGLAHQAKKTVAKLTSAVAWGTPPYMSPEQELGKVSRESDLYSLGACYYEMLTGEPVFIGPDFLKQKREMDYEPATKLRPELPAGVDAVIRKVLAVRPEDRFHTGAEFVAAVEALG